MSTVFVKSFTHLKDRPKADRALPLLQRIASLVKPIMRKHGWVLPVLAEFFPESPNLLGLNINGGQRILLRLRPAHAPDTFYDEEFVVKTMLHELTHNEHGPHDEKFYKFLSELEDEYDTLKRSGYAGEGFFSPGQKLGYNVSHNLPPHLARQKALEAAEKRRQVNLIMSGGGRLGGPNVRTRVHKLPRELAAEAAERRARDEKACALGAVAQREADKAAKESVENKVIDLTNESDSEPENGTLGGPSEIAARSNGSRPARSAVGSSSRGAASHAVGSSSATLVKQATPASQQWPCPQCTLLNEPQTQRCEVCDFTRPIARQESPDSTWSCMMCGETGMPSEFWSCQFCGSIKNQS